MTGEREELILQEIEPFQLLARPNLFRDLDGREENETHFVRSVISPETDRRQGATPYGFRISYLDADFNRTAGDAGLNRRIEHLDGLIRIIECQLAPLPPDDLVAGAPSPLLDLVQIARAGL